MRRIAGRGIGGRRVSGGGGGAAPAWSPLSLVSLHSWYRETVVDAGAGACSEWTDLGASGRHMTQGTAPARPTITASDADFANRLSLSFDGGDRLADATGADTSAWALLSNTASATLWVVFRSANTGATQCLASTYPPAGASIGALLRYDGTSENLDFFVSNGTTYIASGSSAVSSVARSTTHYLVLRKDSSGYDVRVNGASVLAATWGGTPSSGNPVSRLNVGQTSAASNPLTGKEAELGIASAYLSGADLTSLESYLSGRYT